MKNETKILCGYCQEPIHINDFGGVQKDKGFFHSKCVIEAENKLYKPLSEFKWKDATKKEVSEEAIPHYGFKFTLHKHKNMIEKLEQIDKILASFEYWMHAEDSGQCTTARKLLIEVVKELKINKKSR